MLLTLATRSFANARFWKTGYPVGANGSGSLPARVRGESATDARHEDAVEWLGLGSLLDLPEFASRHLKLRGMNVQASMLTGWTLEQLDRLRDRADKAACPCLVLVEDVPVRLGDEDAAVDDEAGRRVETLAMAANRLGCNALALGIEAADDNDSFDRVAMATKDLLPIIERQELNLLLMPQKDLLFQTDRLIDLIKRVGGFRIGSLPSFAHAYATAEPIETLRKLAPYAGAIHASVGDGAGEPSAIGRPATADRRPSAGGRSAESGEPKAESREPPVRRGGKAESRLSFDLASCVNAIRSVGFANTLAIDYIGSGEPVERIEEARMILEQAIEGTE